MKTFTALFGLILYIMAVALFTVVALTAFRIPVR